jgi:hypothetical protein
MTKETITNEDDVTTKETITSEDDVTTKETITTVQLLKKYRASRYDADDEKYATLLKRHELPQAFHDFTDGLMQERYINRFGLLKAIDDYNKTEMSIEFSLPCVFQDAAFNCRPYQQCIIS